MPDIELLETINVRGAHGQIYKIRVRSQSPAGQRLAAMKVPTTPDRGFVREMEIAELLRHYRHPYIIRFIATGIPTDESFILMDLHEEGDLEDLIRMHGPLPMREALDLLIQVAEAIHFMHGLGIYHRDIKAENIVISQTGTPKVMDFGTARVYRRRGGILLPGPEALAGERQVDRRRDARMLGEVLYHALSGTKPYEARLFALAQRRRLAPAASTRQDAHRHPRLYATVDAVLRRALDPGYTQVYEGVRYFLSDLRRLRQECEREEQPLPRTTPLHERLLPTGPGFLERARQEAWEATDREPDNPAPWIHLGNAHLVALQIKAAHRAYAQALQRDPGNVVARINQAYATALLGQWETAMHLAISGAAAAPGALGAVARARHVREARHLVQDAAELYAILDERVPFNRLMRGYAYDAQGAGQRALHEYRTALELDPAYSPAAEALAFLAIRQGDPDAGMAHALLAVRIGQERAEAWLALGRAHLARGEPHDATVALTTAAGLHPNHPYCRRALAEAWIALGEAERAEDEMRHAVRIDPCWCEARLAWGDALCTLGRRAEGEAAYHAAVTSNPECLDADGRPGLSFALDSL
ncbi:MAG TPA: protein kinase [Armatimonadetes bacterium]|nr:protein kinase [Armatimonadota bacterium]